MKRAKGKIKLAFVFFFAVAAAGVLIADSSTVVEPVGAFSTGPPASVSGAPGEPTCVACHESTSSQLSNFKISAPQTYTPGQTYQVIVQHTSADQTRLRWGFQLTALAGNDPAGTFTLLTPNTTQIVEGFGGRKYVEHTLEGTSPGQVGGRVWTFNWTAPPTNVGPVTFYAAGNQANNDGTSGGDRILVTSAASQPAVTPPSSNAPYDFDGDGKTDIGIYRPAPSEWWINRSGTPSQTLALQFGVSGDVPAPGDFTGDGKDDVTFWRPSDGFWYVLRSEDFSFFAFPFGANGDIPVPADYDGDNKADFALFRQASMLWFIARSSGGTDIVQFGLPGDKPMPADYDGDNKADIGVRRQNGGNSEWWISRSTAGSLAVVFGADTDIGVPGDYTGDGKIDIAFWRPSTGFWFVLRSEDFSFFALPFGATGDVPSPGDYDGDGKWDVTVFRPTDTNWYIGRTTGGTQIVQFGAAGDKPIPNISVR